jgi:hypothetical protein
MDVSEEAVFLGLDENTNYPILYLLRNGDVQTVRTVKFTKSFVPATKWTSLGFDQSPMFEEVEDEDYVPSSDEEFAPDFRNELEESKADMNNPENHEETEDLQVLNNNLNEDILPPDIQPAIENVVDHEENNEIDDSRNTNSRPTRQTALNSRLLIQMNNEDMKNIDAQLMSMLATEEEDFQKQIGELNTGELNTPNSWQEALRDPKWRQSMEEEIETLRRMKTWELVDLPPNRKAIKNKWAFKLKQNEKGEVYKFKSRLTACGYSQIENVDFEETYAAVGSRNTLRYMIALTASKGLHMRQIDFESAFLQGELKEEIYMQQPSGFSDGTNRVCRLRKSLYGLKQSSAVWYETISKFILSMGYEVSKVDPCLFLQNKSQELPSYIFLYVDDMLLISDSLHTLDKIVAEFQRQFSIKDLGKPKHILGIELIHTTNGIWIGQKSFAMELVKTFLRHDARPISSPCTSYPEESYKTLDENHHKKYRSLVGGIQYLSQVTRPDLSFIGSLLGKFVSSPADVHWELAIRCLRYLKHTLDEGLFYQKDFDAHPDKDNYDQLTFYSDSDYAGDPLERRSRSGVLSELSGTAIYWRSKQHQSISLSSCEAEYYAIVDNMKEAMNIRLLNWELFNRASFPGEHIITELPTITLHVDNTSAMKTTKNASISDSMKHVQVRYHWIKEKVRLGDLHLQYVRTEENDADMFTKPLNGIKLRSLMRRIGMRKRIDQSLQLPEENVVNR